MLQGRESKSPPPVRATRDIYCPGQDQHFRAPAPGWLLTTTGARCILLIVLVVPKRDRIAERREATRGEILEAAWELAQEQGLAQFTLRDLAERVGMRAPSLYTHFESKLAIYDAMFGQAWSDYEQVALAELAKLPQASRAALRRAARVFFDYAVANPARHQLMNQRTIPGFEPSTESYAPAVRVLELGRQLLRNLGIDRLVRLRHLDRDDRRPDQPAVGQRPRWHAVVGATRSRDRCLG